MALVVSLGWIAIGAIVAFYKYGGRLFGYSISGACGCLIWPISFFALVAAFAKQDYGWIIVWSFVISLLWGFGIISSTERFNRNESAKYGMSASVVFTASNTIFITSLYWIIESFIIIPAVLQLIIWGVGFCFSSKIMEFVLTMMNFPFDRF